MAAVESTAPPKLADAILPVVTDDVSNRHRVDTGSGVGGADPPASHVEAHAVPHDDPHAFI